MRQTLLTIVIAIFLPHFLLAQTDTSKNRKVFVLTPPSNGSHNFIDSLGNKYFDNGYYKWKVTGDAAVDAQNLDSAARDFKQNNFSTYDKMICDTVRIITITQSDLNSMSERKKTFILSQPKLFHLVADTNAKN
jgi:hypothetical protein